MIHFTSIMHPSDFSENSDQALYYAAAFADKYDASLHLVHVISDPAVAVPSPIAGFLPAGYFEEMEANSNETLSKIANREWVKDNRTICKTMTGNTSQMVVNYAKENDIDLIVMGTHGYSGLSHMIMGSVAENVLRTAPCPVLTVRPEKYEFIMP